MHFGPGLLREVGAALQFVGVRTGLVPAAELPDTGSDVPIILVPGFLCSDKLFAPLHDALSAAGHPTFHSGTGRNAACSEATVARLEQRATEVKEETGRRVVLVGYSRGGQFAKVVGFRRPDLVHGVVTLGTPSLSPLSVHALIAASAIGVTALGTLGIPGAMRASCFVGDCCRRFREDLHAPLGDPVRYVAVTSPRDAVVDHRYTADEGAHRVEARCTHIGYVGDASARAALASSLELLAAA